MHVKKKVVLKMRVTERYRAPLFRMFWKNTKTEKSVNLPNISPNIASKKQMLPIKIYIFGLGDLSASQRCKNEIHTLLVSKADFFHLRLSSLLLHFLTEKTNATLHWEIDYEQLICLIDSRLNRLTLMFADNNYAGLAMSYGCHGHDCHEKCYLAGCAQKDQEERQSTLMDVH